MLLIPRLSFPCGVNVGITLKIVVEHIHFISEKGRLVKDDALFFSVNHLNLTLNGRIEFSAIFFAAWANELRRKHDLYPEVKRVSALASDVQDPETCGGVDEL